MYVKRAWRLFDPYCAADLLNQFRPAELVVLTLTSY